MIRSLLLEPLDARDRVTGSALACAAIFYVAIAVEWDAHPAEDAAMLLRYAEHLAAGYGIVWNIGEEPVDGATDFLFLIVLAATRSIGVPIEFAAKAITTLAFAATVGLVYAGMRMTGGQRLFAVFGAAFFAAGPSRRLIQAAFATTFFVLLVTLAWLMTLRFLDRTTWQRAAWVGLAAVAVGFARPDGVLMAGWLIAGLVAAFGFRHTHRGVIAIAACYATLGLAYFLWRWWYFGQPFPNPFYVKGGGALYPASLSQALKNGIWLTMPFLPLVPLGMRNAATRRALILAAVPIGGYLCSWVLLSNEMNIEGRFQLAVQPPFLMVMPLWLRGVVADVGLPSLTALPRHVRRPAIVSGMAVLVGLLAIEHRRYGSGHTVSWPSIVAQRLAEYSERGHTMAVSEAGLLPFYSRWRAIDAWGLNDRTIARSGPVTAEYLDRSAPAVVMFYAYFSPLVAPAANPSRWDTMTITLYKYAVSRGYRLALIVGDRPSNVHYYFVNPRVAEHDALIVAIRQGALTPIPGARQVDFTHVPPVWGDDRN